MGVPSRGSTHKFQWRDGPTEVHIIYPKNHNFRICLPQKIITFFSIPKKIPQAFFRNPNKIPLFFFRDLRDPNNSRHLS